MSDKEGGGAGIKDDYGRLSAGRNLKALLWESPKTLIKNVICDVKYSMRCLALGLLLPVFLMASPAISLISAATNINVAKVLAPTNGSK